MQDTAATERPRRRYFERMQDGHGPLGAAEGRWHTATHRIGAGAMRPEGAITRSVRLPSGIDLHVRTLGQPGAPMVVVLHGFPETGDGFMRLATSLASEGWYVVVPDQRGYGRSDKPAELQSYALDVLADDVLELATALGHRSFCVVGHDWGGLIAWHLAARNPERLSAACILNAPHPAGLLRFALGHPMQWLRSAYIAVFQLPLLPEWLLGLRDHALLVRMLTWTGRPHAFAPEVLARYREAWRAPGAVHAMLQWYRAMRLSRPLHVPIHVPLRILWGERDAALSPALADDALRHCLRGDLVRLPDSSHWLHHEVPDVVAARISGFLRRWVHPRSTGGRFAEVSAWR